MMKNRPTVAAKSCVRLLAVFFFGQRKPIPISFRLAHATPRALIHFKRQTKQRNNTSKPHRLPVSDTNLSHNQNPPPGGSPSERAIVNMRLRRVTTKSNQFQNRFGHSDPMCIMRRATWAAGGRCGNVALSDSVPTSWASVLYVRHQGAVQPRMTPSYNTTHTSGCARAHR